MLLRLASPDLRRVQAYVSEPAARQLQPGQRAQFTADAQPLSRRAARVVSIAPHATAVLPDAVLAQTQGGLIDAREQQGRWLPLQPVYRVELELDEPAPLALRRWRGHVVVELSASSLWQRLWRAGAEVLSREAGF